MYSGKVAVPPGGVVEGNLIKLLKQIHTSAKCRYMSMSKIYVSLFGST
jgi:hypothetical protein